MSPRAADPAVRTSLLDNAARLLAEEGPSALTTRRLAEEVGTSTMAVYTHFGGKEDLLAAISVEGFRRLAHELAAVGRTDDPVADLAGLGLAYRRNALVNPNLYRVMFGASPVSTGLSEADLAMSLGTFVTLVEGTDRCIVAGRFSAADPTTRAAQLWSAAHGVVMLELAGFFSAPGEASACFVELMRAALVGFGDDPQRVGRSFEAAAAARP